jgi:hypothetical protein
MMALDVARGRHMESSKSAVSKSFRAFFVSNPSVLRHSIRRTDRSCKADAADLIAPSFGFLPSSM